MTYTKKNEILNSDWARESFSHGKMSAPRLHCLMVLSSAVEGNPIKFRTKE